MSVTVRFGDDILSMLRLFVRMRVRFYGLTVGRYGFGVIVYSPKSARQDGAE